MKQHDQVATAAVLLAIGAATLAGSTCQPRPAKAEPAPVAFIVDLNKPPVYLPAQMAERGGAVSWCESKFRADAVSPTGDYGFWQLNRRWQEQRVNRMGYQWSDMLDARLNTIVAIAIWSEQGWGPWSCGR